MNNALFRKVGQFLTDPVLRSWALGRLLGRWPSEPKYVSHRPPYLVDMLPLIAETPSGDFSQLPESPPVGQIELSLAGTRIQLEPGDEVTLFKRTFDDIEVTLALHRFAWLPFVLFAIP